MKNPFHFHQHVPTRRGLNAGFNEDNAQIKSSDGDDKFDGKGFANYLGPYALALVGSIAVTAAFVKFVLMDY